MPLNILLQHQTPSDYSLIISIVHLKSSTGPRSHDFSCLDIPFVRCNPCRWRIGINRLLIFLFNNQRQILVGETAWTGADIWEILLTNLAHCVLFLILIGLMTHIDFTWVKDWFFIAREEIVKCCIILPQLNFTSQVIVINLCLIRFGPTKFSRFHLY